MSKRNRIIIFTRYPEPGRTKTRLIPELGKQGAADLQKKMAEKIVRAVSRFCETEEAEMEIRYYGGSQEKMKQWLGPEVRITPQGEGDLGEKMSRAFSEAFSAEARNVALIGADCPGIDADILGKAFESLKKSAEVVFGPAEDGGYYLIGMNRHFPELFKDIPWGTQRVCELTKKKILQLGLRYSETAELRDVDRPEDLPVWNKRKKEKVLLSIIIPVLNEEKQIESILERVSRRRGVELIVVDGGSEDQTREIAENYADRVLFCSCGRARQMNLGAKSATGDFLLFLHADTKLPDHFPGIIAETLDPPGVSAGAFRLRLNTRNLFLKFIEWTANLRARFLKLPYGDQAIFLRKGIFESIGGYKNLPIMEDYDLVKRLSGKGRIVIVRDHAVTSARRWEKHGILKTWLMHKLVIIAWKIGINPEKIARWRKGK